LRKPWFIFDKKEQIPTFPVLASELMNRKC
jgi:hypothetical protein